MKRYFLTIMFVLMACTWSQSNASNQKLPSLCDQWNILGIADVDGYEVFHTFTQTLTTDTIINGLRYLRLEQNNAYLGALREGDHKEIYYIPSGTTHKYLLYAFNAKVGDRLSDLWYGGKTERCSNGYNATILSISEGTPRVFTVEVEYVILNSQGEQIIPWTIYWIEGVGLIDGPVGHDCPGPDCEGDYGQQVLCAQKNGEQVYVSKFGEQYGCEYNYNPMQSIETVIIDSSSISKIFRDSRIFLLIGNKTYTLTGQEVR